MSEKLDAFNQKLGENHYQGQWELRRELDEGESNSDLVPYVWRWSEISELLKEATEVLSLDEQPQGARRTILLNNPNHAFTSQTLAAAVQRVEPGETAKAHKHNMTAFRFGIKGSESMFTTVEGERFPMERGDLVLTPQMTWHDHVNKSDEPAIWLDGIDSPLIGGIGVAEQENFESERQTVDKPDGYSDRTLSMIRPVHGGTDRDSDSSPPYRYRWTDAKQALDTAISRDESHNPYNGYTLEYVNPRTGRGPALQTMSLYLQQIEKGKRTMAHRHNSVELYHVVKGSGRTHVDEDVLEWERRDCFMVPRGRWHAHETEDDAVLFRISDKPVLDAFNIYEESTEQTGDAPWSEQNQQTPTRKLQSP